MKKRLYIETTVVSYLTAKPSRDIIIAGHQGATQDIWPDLSVKFETYVSALVFEEARKGDLDKMLRRIIEDEGYECPEICSPEELLEVNR